MLDNQSDETNSPVAPGGGTTNFTVVFDPAAVGSSSATLTIANDDPDENPYDFAIRGAGIVSTNVSVSGRVSTPAGLGLRNAIVSITDSQGVRRTATTTSFGFYNFDEVASGRNYVVTVSSRRYRFASRPLLINDNVSNLDFVAQE